MGVGDDIDGAAEDLRPIDVTEPLVALQHPAEEIAFRAPEVFGTGRKGRGGHAG